jgi:hypothetical protein
MKFETGWVYPEAKLARWRDIQFARLFGREAVGVDKGRGVTIRGYWIREQLYVTEVTRTVARGFDRLPPDAIPAFDQPELPIEMPPRAMYVR